MDHTDTLLVNFGGPRSKSEIPSFLTELLCDKDVVRTRFPQWLHNLLFSRIARKRALKIGPDYEEIGGRSPIYFDTEAIAKSLSSNGKVLTFHRYLVDTHKSSLSAIETSSATAIRVFPLFPQYSTATTGSIARFFSRHLSKAAVQKLRWVKSYPDHPSFIASYQRRVRGFLLENNLPEEQTALLFSAHGIPQSFVDAGDTYYEEVLRSFSSCLKAFPNILGRLSFQSKFGKGEWIKPYTDESCRAILEWHEGRKHIVFIPISFTSDHIETLYEIEKLYLPLILQQKLKAYRCPALNLEPYWIQAIAQIAQDGPHCSNASLFK